MEFLIIFLIVGLPLGISAFIAGFSAKKDERMEAEQKWRSLGCHVHSGVRHHGRSLPKGGEA